ncbi:unnamed protein product [Sphenostylis stenocarpa]|uniref:PPC domain-containing protein n=1 Tax=Sphenostylis stenocarpa TaxID=92480 RepID=A0AA86VQ38_9FABA|nr:unnamed protein product [Sphenostylis stenocarpa]
MELSLSQNPLHTNSDFESSGDYRIGSSSHCLWHSFSLPNANQSMKVVTINVGEGCDVMESIVDVARRSQASLVVHGASGTVASATLHNTVRGAPTYRIYGPFNLLSLTGSYFYTPHDTHLPGATSSLSFGIQLCTYSRIICGRTTGTVIAGGDVILIVSTFKNPKINKYVPEGEERDNVDNDNNNNHDPGYLAAFNSAVESKADE